MAKALIVPPAAPPASLSQVKEHLRVETNDEDAYLASLASAATAHVEALSGRLLISQTWRVYVDEMPENRCVFIPVAPTRSIAAITVYNAAGNAAVLSPGSYVFAAHDEPPTVEFDTAIPPQDFASGIEIDVVAGYGETAADVPGQLIRAILVLCAHWHAFRGAAVDAAAAGIVPAGFDKLLAPFRQVRL